MKVRYRRRARIDLDGIFDYLNERNPVGAENVMRAILAGVQFIAENPQGVPRTDDPTIRVMIVRRYRYRIFYSVTGDELEILHIRHGARRPWKGR
jgi:plasmid stabilization system protein ParE